MAAHGRNTGQGLTHSPRDQRGNLLKAPKALKVEKVDLRYLHGPDQSTHYEDTLREATNLHREGYFDRVGISN